MVKNTAKIITKPFKIDCRYESTPNIFIPLQRMTIRKAPKTVPWIDHKPPVIGIPPVTLNLQHI